MNPSTPEFAITPAMVSDAEQEKDRLEQVINDAQRKHGLILQFLRLAAAYKVTAVPAQDIQQAEEAEEPAEEDDSATEVDPTNVMGTMRRIANSSPRPLGKRELRAAMIAAGVNAERVSGPYFYVAITRLKEKEYISVLDDGRVWKALPKN